MNSSEPLLSQDTPRAIELLAAARTHLLEVLLPSTAGDSRYSALMIANALSIALAELEQQRANPHMSVKSDVGEQLCHQLRDGAVEDLFDDDLLKCLQSDVDARLSVANPKRLSP